MKIYARLTNEKGKTDGMGANEKLDIEISVGNSIIASLTVKEDEDGTFSVFNHRDEDIGVQVLL